MDMTVLPNRWSGISTLLALFHFATEISMWNNCTTDLQAIKSNCRKDNYLTYCIQVHRNNTFIETCLPRLEIPKDIVGCPWLTLDGETVRLGVPFTKCNSSLQGCPPENHPGYSTDQLSKLYQLCLVPEEERTEECIRCKSTKKYTGVTHYPPEISSHATYETIAIVSSSSQGGGLTVALATIIVVEGIALICCILYICGKLRRWNMCRKKYSPVPPDEENPLSDVGKREDSSKDEVKQISYFLNGSGDSASKTDHFLETEVSEKLRKALDEEGKQVVWLHGFSGTGKTHTAKWYAMHAQSNAKNRETMAWILDFKNKDTLHSSMIKMAKSLEIKFLREVQTVDKDILSLAEGLRKTNDKSIHVLIFDQITGVENSKFMENIISILRKNKSFKCIITSGSEPELDVDAVYRLHVPGFTTEESTRYMKDYGKESELRAFADLMGNSPLALRVAKTYMRKSCIKVNIFMDCISVNKNHSGASGDKILDECMDPLRLHVKSMKERNPELFELLRYISLIKSSDIPVYLFIFIQSEKKFKDANLVTNEFVQIVKKSSLGYVDGEDSRRMLNANDLVRPVFKQYYGDAKENSDASFKLLKCFSWLVNKDQGHSSDQQRSIEVLPHAEELIGQIRYSSFGKASDSIMHHLAYIMVCDRMCFSYRFLGFITKQRKLSRAMVVFIYSRILHESKFPIDDQIPCIEAVFKKLGGKTTENPDQAAKNIADLLDKILKRELTKISSMAVEYVKNKHRVVHQREFLCSNLGKEKLDRKVQLSDIEFRKLQEHEVALTDEQMGDMAKIFLYEIIISVFLHYGLHTTDKHEDGEESQRCTNHVLIAYRLADILQENVAKSKINPFCALDVDLRGKVELQLRNGNGSKKRNGSLNELLESEKRLVGYMQEEKTYCETGLFIVHSSDLEVQVSCLRQLLRVCERVSLWQQHKEEYLRKSIEYAKTLKEKLETNKEKLYTAISSQKAKRAVAEFYIKQLDYQSAKSVLENVSHIRIDKLKKCPPTQYDIRDLKMLCRCYQELNDKSKANETKQNVAGLRKSIPPEYMEAHIELQNFDEEGFDKL